MTRASPKTSFAGAGRRFKRENKGGDSYDQSGIEPRKAADDDDGL